MKKILLTAGLLLASASAFAQDFYVDSYDMTCADAQELVMTEGSVVIHSGDLKYDRYVSDLGFCDGLGGRAGFIETMDTPYCRVGYKCR